MRVRTGGGHGGALLNGDWLARGWAREAAAGRRCAVVHSSVTCDK
ncbi:hypothetical protein SCATT_00720 [Streptantibioticus cattleyicolor NRRL 8057 = DSM 46488]|uniref:Uncharacterized protein n=1 Tax=Streptantibioticus cattleyicolor (strain ATCC 35852 / DSM 46488 / JCM 4925 / NBRC 14057 / NRRL 8057) TaxID=1003195 RepID=G8WYQ3_STREN|nr:hypothetical protein SCATT_00720 [Streptantibioticus cattleyicolor NRRL 8057 = DSM 46488]